MADINRVVISGRLTRNPELKAISSTQTSVLSFSLAVNDRRRNQQTQQWEDYANFIDCTMFGARAESLSHILTKGMGITVEGKLHYSSWVGKDGSKRSGISVTVDEVVLPARAAVAQAQQPAQYTTAQQITDAFAATPAAQAQQQVDQTYDAEIPF